MGGWSVNQLSRTGSSSARQEGASNETVAFGRDPEDGGCLLHIDLVVRWPDVDPEIAAPLLEKADSVCPYARMAWQGTPTTITPAS
ncbi:hypothetical protein [Streptomyces bicolor]|uniref:hypothetical protein n=1 Tax=Streptomyces bicolor TaxID=66874 RepID=UPI000AF59C94|nr:hypothetical protein [Streptomyces bicolor]